MEALTIYDLEVGESIRYDDMSIIRVTGGWHYIYFNPSCGVATSVVFVPWEEPIEEYYDYS